MFVISQFLWVKSPGTAKLGALQGASQVLGRAEFSPDSLVVERSASKLTCLLAAFSYLPDVTQRLPLHRAAHNKASYFFKTSKTDVTVLCNGNDMPSLLPYSFSGKPDTQIPPTLKERKLCKGMNTRK